ncbi:hypothetical protein AA313_de0206772 [Arthrobotrys entomopaga]|nr:hypothetical protein AA313_de0206772 [Arthrobotrys entomopaga]
MLGGRASQIKFTARDIPLRKNDKENPRDYSKRTPSGTVIKGTHEDPFLPPLPYPVRTYRTCGAKPGEKVIFGVHWGTVMENGLEKMKRLSVPSPTKQQLMRVVFCDVTQVSLIRHSSFIRHYAPPVHSSSASVSKNNCVYMPTTLGWFKFAAGSCLPYRPIGDLMDHFFYSPELKTCADSHDFDNIADSLIPLPLEVLGFVTLPIVLPMDTRATYIQQFLIVDDIFPLDGHGADDIDMVIDIEGFGSGAYWPHPWGIVPVIEKGKARVHTNKRGMIELITIGVLKEYDDEMKKATIGIGTWFGRNSMYNHATTVEMDLTEPQFAMLSSEYDIVQMVAMIFALEKCAAMFTEMGVVATGVNIAVPSKDVHQLINSMKDRRVIPLKEGWNWLAVMEFLKRLKYRIEAEFLDLQKWEPLREVVEFAAKGKKDMSRDMVYDAAEVWSSGVIAEKKGCQWFGGEKEAGEKLLKDLEALGRWEEWKKGVHEIKEGDFKIRGWPTFLDIGKARQRIEEAVPRVCKNTAF